MTLLEQVVMQNEWRRKAFTISTDRSRLQIDVIHGFLAHSYWAKGIPRALLQRAIENSLCFGVYDAERQVGFARVVSDCATFAWLSDVFILEEHRKQGLSKWLIETIVAHPELQGLRRFILATADAHGLYRAYGFKPLERPERYMERLDPDVYVRGGS